MSKKVELNEMTKLPQYVSYKCVHTIPRVFLGPKKGQVAENKKRADLIFLRAHFWFPKALLSLKVYDTFNMKINIVKRHPFSFFSKGQEGWYFLNEKQQGRYSFYERATRAMFILWKSRQGAAPFLNCLGETLLNLWIM